jgi:comEA protein
MRRYSLIFASVIMSMAFVLSATFALAQGAAKADTGKTTAQVASKVNINKATVEQLMEIKGIGEAYAKRIVEYREKNGPFKKIEDITLVQGIGDKKFEAMKDLITVESAK